MAGDVVEIRRAKAEDIDKVAELLSAAKLPLAGVSECIERFLVAEASGTIVGSVGIEKHGNYGLLRSAAVSEALRGRGVGRRLVDEAIDDARDEGIRALYLLTTTAQDYFPEFGFERIDRELVPAELNASAELQGACPSSATVMRMGLD
jgi:amino-acid N-acetyltransferase